MVPGSWSRIWGSGPRQGGMERGRAIQALRQVFL